MTEAHYLITIRWSSGAEDTFPVTKHHHDFFTKDNKLVDALNQAYLVDTSDGGKVLLKLNDAVAVRLVTVSPDEEYIEAEVTVT